MSTWVKVMRYHLVAPLIYVVSPWLVLGFGFAVVVIIFTVIQPGPGPHYVGTLLDIYAMFFALGIVIIARSLPFGLTLGISRRSYYLGTTLLAISVAAVDGLALTLLQLIEAATGGFGLSVHFFRVPYILDGPWFLTWLTSFVGLALCFVYGMWFGLAYRRWNLLGIVVFAGAQVTVLLAGALVATWTNAWPGIGRFFSGLTAPGLTGLLAALVAVLMLGGYRTIRRVTV